MAVLDPPPELPVFPARKGDPDQPKAFFDKFLAYLAWLATLRDYLVSIYGDGTGTGGVTGTEKIYMPMTNGEIPPVFVQNSDGGLIYTRVE